VGGGGGTGRTQTLSIAPTFSPWPRATLWRNSWNGSAVGDRGSPAGAGVQGVDAGASARRIPDRDGERDRESEGGQHLRRPGLRVQLLSQKLNESAPRFCSTSTSPTQPATVLLPAVKQVNNDQLVVRGDTFKYLIVASLTGADAAAQVALYGVQITCVAV